MSSQVESEVNEAPSQVEPPIKEVPLGAPLSPKEQASKKPSKIVFRNVHKNGTSYSARHFKVPSVVQPVLVNKAETDIVDKGYLPAIYSESSSVRAEYDVIPYSKSLIVYEGIDFVTTPSDFKNPDIPDTALWSFALLPNIRPQFPILNKTIFVQTAHAAPYTAYKDYFEYFSDAANDKFGTSCSATMMMLKPVLSNYLYVVDSSTEECFKLTSQFINLFDMTGKYSNNILLSDEPQSIYDFAYLVANSYYYASGTCNTQVTLEQLRFATVSAYIGILMYPFAFVRFSAKDLHALYSSLVSEVLSEFINNGAYVLMKALSGSKFIGLQVQPSAWGCFVLGLYKQEPSIDPTCIIRGQQWSFHSSTQARKRIKKKGVHLDKEPDTKAISERFHSNAYSEALQNLRRKTAFAPGRPVGYAATDGDTVQSHKPHHKHHSHRRRASRFDDEPIHGHQRPTVELPPSKKRPPPPPPPPQLSDLAAFVPPESILDLPDEVVQQTTDPYAPPVREVGKKTKHRGFDVGPDQPPPKITNRELPNFAPSKFVKKRINIGKFRSRAQNANPTTASVNKRKGTPMLPDGDDDFAIPDVGYTESFISGLKDLPSPPADTGLSYIPVGTSARKLLGFIQNQILAFLNVKHLDGLEDSKLQAAQKAVYDATIPEEIYVSYPAFNATFTMSLVLNTKQFMSTQDITQLVKSSLPKEAQPTPIQLTGPVNNQITECKDGTYNNHISIPISAPLFTSDGAAPTSLDSIVADYKVAEFVAQSLSHGQTPTNDKLLYQFITGNGMKLPAMQEICSILVGDNYEESADYESVRHQILDSITKFAKYPGTICGQLCRFGQGLAISHRSCRSVDDPYWIRPHFDIVPLIDIYNNSIDEVVLQFATSNLVRTNDGASTGIINHNQKRDLLTDVMDAKYFKTWMNYRLVFEDYYADPEHAKEPEFYGDKVFYDAASYAEMKPKDEVIERAKAFIKSRTIFVLNAFTQLPFNVTLAIGELFEGAAMRSMLNPCLLGVDAQVYLRNLLRLLVDKVRECDHEHIPFGQLSAELVKRIGADCPYIWSSYSDNCYCLNLDNFSMISYDGEKMESSVKGDDLMDCMKDMFGEEDIFFDFKIPTDQAKFFARTNRHSKEVNGELYAEFEIQCAPPDPGFSPLHVNPASLSLSPFINFVAPLARQLYSGIKVWLKIKDHELLTVSGNVDGHEVLILYGVHGPSVCKQIQRWYLSYKNAMKELVDNTICIMGPSAFRSSFLPSGARFTSIINTYKTLGTVLFLREQRASPDWFAEHLPKSWVVKVEATADLRPILFEGTSYMSQLTQQPQNGDLIRTDFLGFDVVREYNVWAVILRKTALFPNPFYHQYYSKSGSLDSQRNETAMYLSVLINGGIYYPPLMAAILARVPYLAKEALVSLDQIAIMLSVLGVTNVDLSFVSEADNIWANVFTMAYNRSIIIHTEELNNKINDAANVLSAMIESVPVIQNTLDIRTLQSLSKKAIVKATNNLVGNKTDVRDPLPFFMKILEAYLDDHRQVSGVPVVLSLFVAVLFQYYLTRFQLDYAVFANRVQKATADQFGLQTAQEVSDSIVAA